MVRFNAILLKGNEHVVNIQQVVRTLHSYALKEAAKALTYQVAHDISPEKENRVGSDAAKLFAGPAGKTCADYAMQVLGGAGYCKEYPVEKLWRDAKLLEIGGGTLEAHHKNLTKDLCRDPSRCSQ